MIDFLISVLFGIVEGVTEWLPVSSTGHMILFNEFIKFDVSAEFWEMYLVVIQLGAILAVVLLFWDDIWPFCRRGNGRLPDGSRYNGSTLVLNMVRQDTFIMWFKIAVACLPAVIIELAFGDMLEALFYNYITVSVMLIIVGVLFIIVEQRGGERTPEICTISGITYKTAFLIGVFQLIAAVFPGTSRSGATIIGGLILGLSRKVSAEFTFYLAIPVMFGASLIKAVKFGGSFTSQELGLLLAGMASAFAVSVIVIRFLMGYIKKHDFKVFGWYRILLGVLVLFYSAI